MNSKEKFLSVLRGEGKQEWLGYAFDAFPKPYPITLDPVTMLDASLKGESFIDAWGATWRHTDNDPGAVPLVTQENKVIKDLEHWRDYVKFPDLENLDWSFADEQLSKVDRSDTVVMVASYYGPFERAHALMPFEDCLIAMYEEPEIMYDLIGALTDWKIKALEKVIDYMQPDIIHSHDDWGDNTRLFFSPEKFREILKPHYTRLYDYIKSRGVLIQHHNDGWGEGLETDLVEMGVDMWQGVIATQDLQKIKANTQGKLLLIGGIDQLKIDGAVIDEAAAREEVRRAIDTYAPGGHYLPSLPSVMPCNFPLLPIIMDEADSYGAKWLAANK